MNTVPNLDEFFSLIFPYLAKILSLIISLTDHIVGVVLQRIESRDINLANRNVNTSFAFVSSFHRAGHFHFPIFNQFLEKDNFAILPFPLPQINRHVRRPAPPTDVLASAPERPPPTAAPNTAGAVAEHRLRHFLRVAADVLRGEVEQREGLRRGRQHARRDGVGVRHRSPRRGGARARGAVRDQMHLRRQGGWV